MANVFDQLFEAQEQVTTDSKRSMPETRFFVQAAELMHKDIQAEFDANPDQWKDKIAASINEPALIESLIDEIIGSQLLEYAPDNVADIPDEILQNIRKSQQSKRSRLAKMHKTQERYAELFKAVIIDKMIRGILGVTNSTRGRRHSTSLTPTEEELMYMSAEDLAIKIRNIQSQKSIYKTGFETEEEYTNTERWQELLKAEQMYRDARKKAPSISNLYGNLQTLLKESGGIETGFDKLNKVKLVELVEAIYKLVNPDDVDPQIDLTDENLNPVETDESGDTSIIEEETPVETDFTEDQQ